MPTVKALDKTTGLSVCLHSCSLLSEAIRWAHGYKNDDDEIAEYDTIIVNDASGATVYTIPSPETSED